MEITTAVYGFYMMGMAGRKWKMRVFNSSDRRMDFDQLRSIMVSLFLGAVLAGCAAIDQAGFAAAPITPAALPAETSKAENCPVTEPVLATPPEDSAVQNPPSEGTYFLNEDRSIWASAWWTGLEEAPLRLDKDGYKVGWFRPAGAELRITGERIDADAPELESHVPCCYPTQFQATGLTFPTEGCWRITATAADREISFVVLVLP